MNYSKILLRLMSPLGRYPENSFLSNDASFIVDRRAGYIYSIVRTSDIDRQYFNSEIAWASVSEIRLWASIVLSIGNENGIFNLYPNNTHIRSDDTDFSNMSFSDGELINEIRRYLGNKTEGINYMEDIWNSISGVEFDEELQYQLFYKIDLNNHILIRGLSYILKSQLLMASNFYLFIEEAALLIHLAMEGSIKYIHKNMRGSGKNNPSNEDVFKYINDNYVTDVKLEELTDYFKSCYQNRTILIHPDNYISTLAIPDLSSEDFFEIYRHMVKFYRDIIIGENSE